MSCRYLTCGHSFGTITDVGEVPQLTPPACQAPSACSSIPGTSAPSPQTWGGCTTSTPDRPPFISATAEVRETTSSLAELSISDFYSPLSSSK